MLQIFWLSYAANILLQKSELRHFVRGFLMLAVQKQQRVKIIDWVECVRSKRTCQWAAISKFHNSSPTDIQALISSASLKGILIIDILFTFYSVPATKVF